MASESRRATASVSELLYAKPAAFEFFQAVRLLRRMGEGQGRVGAEDPEDERVRFRSEVSLSFPAADVTRLARPGEEERAAVVTVGFLGVATPGSFGSLPTPYAQEILDQQAQKNTALRDFLDLFNHRVISLFYRAWEKHCLPVQYESGGGRYFERALFGLLGLGTEGLRGRLGFDDHALLPRAGLLGMRPLPAVALQAALESYFRVPVDVVQFQPAWYDIAPEEQNRLGARNSRLGDDLFLGGRVKLEQFKFGLRVGPLDWDTYQEFFPTAPGFRALVDLVRLATTPELDFEVRPVLRAEDVAPLRLEHTPSRATRLGWSTWLADGGFARDADDAVLLPPESAGRARSATAPGSMEVRP